MTHLVLGFAVEGNAPPPKKITSWFLSKGQGKTRDDSADYIPHDIYVIGTQEDPLGEKEWLEILKSSLQEITSMTFKTVSSGHGPAWDSGAVGFARPARSVSEAGAARPIGSRLPKMPGCSVVPPLPGPERGTCVQKSMGPIGVAENHGGPPAALPVPAHPPSFLGTSSAPAPSAKILCLVCGMSLGVP